MKPPVTIVTQLEEQHVAQLCALYHEEWWTLQRDPETVSKMLKHSDVVLGLLDGRNNLVGFSRVLSDYTYKALILDVIVSREWRGRGLGQLLLNTIITYPDFKGVHNFELYCLPELEPFYRKWGFRNISGNVVLMRTELKVR